MIRERLVVNSTKKKMKKEQNFKLIDGCFSPKESREIISSVFASKILFHKIKNLSSLERFGKEDETAINRIHHLKKSMENLFLILDEAEKKGCKLEVSSKISIQFAK